MDARRGLDVAASRILSSVTGSFALSNPFVDFRRYPAIGANAELDRSGKAPLLDQAGYMLTAERYTLRLQVGKCEQVRHCHVRSHRLLILMSRPRERRHRQRSGHCTRFPPSPSPFGRFETIELLSGQYVNAFAKADLVRLHEYRAWIATLWAAQTGHDATPI